MSKPKPKPPTLEDLKTMRNALMISGENPEKLQQIISQIEYLEYGIC